MQPLSSPGPARDPASSRLSDQSLYQNGRGPLRCELSPALNLDLPLFGGKGCGLIRLHRLKPERLIPTELITSVNYHRLIQANGLSALIQSLDDASNAWLEASLKSAAPGDTSEVENIGRTVHDSLARAEIPDESAAALMDSFSSLKKCSPLQRLYIMRSSALTEDMDASMAGQNASVAGIADATTLFAGYRVVCASLFSPKAINYRLMQMFYNGWGEQTDDFRCWTHGRASMAMVFQPMVDAAASGVVFSSDVRRGGEGMLIEAVRGLGDTYVDGTVTPSHWLFDSKGRTLHEKKLVAQENVKHISTSGILRVTWSALKPCDQFIPPLSDEVAEILAYEGAGIAKDLRQSDPLFSGKGIDLEYAVDCRDRIVYLQLRPQTAAIHRAGIDPLVKGIRPSSRLQAAVIETSGESASLGAARGRLVLISDPSSRNPEHDLWPLARRHLQSGDILVTPTTNIGWTPIFQKLAGVLAERGGVMSHTAIIARERSLPAVVGAWGVMEKLAAFLKQCPDLKSEEDGKVLILPSATLDANNCRLCLASLPIETAELSQFLDPAVETRSADYYVQRTEFPHFVDEAGREWTGKPEYRMRLLQFELYARGWERAFELLNMTDEERRVMPLMVSMARADPSQHAERRIGRIRPGASMPLWPDEYPVIAFPTEELARLGDRIREKGLGGKGEVFEQILAFHKARKQAFARFKEFMSSIAPDTDPFNVEYPEMFRLYSDTIGFAHLRAAFRRRVAGPLRAEWLERVPEEMRAVTHRLSTMFYGGLYSETTHGRDVEYRQLLLSLAADPELVDLFTSESSSEIENAVLGKHAWAMAAIASFASRYKVFRSQTDHLENELPISNVLEILKKDIRDRDICEPMTEILLRTEEGFQTALSPLIAAIKSRRPDFPDDAFLSVLSLARETAALTDTERHQQHRHQYQMLGLLRRLERRLHASGDLEAGRAIFDLGRDEIIRLTARKR